MVKIFINKIGPTGQIQGDLSSLTNGNNMFYECNFIVNFNADLSSLRDAEYMFNNCSNLISFSGDLSSLTNGRSMFYGCPITSFSGDLSSLTNGYLMFGSCTNLTSFSGDLSSLTNGYQMFNTCSNLTSFSGDLSSLTNGSGMFGSAAYNCSKLNLLSVQNISQTINDLASIGTTGTINLGINKTIQGNTELEVALATIRSKGWTVSEIYK